MKKRIVALMMGITLLAGCLTGCGGGATGVGSNKEGAAKLTGEKIKITAQLHGWGKDWIDNAAEEFTYRTGIEVSVEWDALLSANLITMLENEEMINSDIYISPNIAEQDLLTEGWIEDMTDFMKEPIEAEGGKSLIDRMEEGVYQSALDEDGNEIHGVVKLTNPNFGMVYNKKMMSYLCHDVLGWEEGHDYPINTKELFEVVDALNKVCEEGTNKELFTYTQDGKTYDVKPIIWSGSTGSLEFIFYPWFAQYIGLDKLNEYLAETGDKPSMLNDEGNFIVYQKICDLIGMAEDKNGNVYPANSVPNCVSYNHTSAQSHFFLGKALLLPGASWVYKEMESIIENEQDWGYIPTPYLSDEQGNPLVKEGTEMPKHEDGSYVNYTYAHGKAADAAIIPIYSENKEIAKQFLRFLTSSEYLPTLADDINSPVAYTCDYSKIENKTYWFEQVLEVQEKTRTASWFSTNPMSKAMGFVHVTESAPYTQLSVGTFGNVLKMVDSANGEELSDGATPEGCAVSENVYKYVTENFKAALVTWNRRKASLGR